MQRRSWVVGDLLIRYPDMGRDKAETIYEAANTGNIMQDIKAAAIELLNAPRDWGRGTNSSLADVIGQAIVRASKVTLASADFESIRSQILMAMRTPASQT
jgi:hypothetical protein